MGFDGDVLRGTVGGMLVPPTTVVSVDAPDPSFLTVPQYQRECHRSRALVELELGKEPLPHVSAALGDRAFGPELDLLDDAAGGYCAEEACREGAYVHRARRLS
jgi:hypothetical protein